jgi:tRNA modification GTPase
MNYRIDTIAAQATAFGNAAIHLIRLSGEEAISICDRIFRGQKKLSESPARRAQFGRIYDGDSLIDDVLITIFPGPMSYTGEDVVEISCHGNQYISDRIMEVLLQDSRLAEPGEFTQRAFINGKIDLTQAEAVGDLLAASTRRAHNLAINQLEGGLQRKIEDFLAKITELRMQIELEIDFPDDFPGGISYSELGKRFDELYRELGLLEDSGREGIILRNGYRVSLVGPPNVGKSSIFNAFLKSARAIVTPEPGTTRDYLQEALAIDGFLVIFFDTAGIRDSDDKIELMGMERSNEVIDNSDLVIYVIEPGQEEEQAIFFNRLPAGKTTLKVINKTDLIDVAAIKKYEQKGYIPCSATRENGLESVKKEILRQMNIKPESLEAPHLTNARQIAAARRALSELAKAKISIANKNSMEFIAFDLRMVSEALEEITGVISSDDILDKIFANFCIGK